MTQCEKILTIMLSNPYKRLWFARDFQQGEYFVGYEASARMSDLIRLHPNVFTVGKSGKFRWLRVNWDAAETQALLREYEIEG